jgi:hypothetical protein
MPRDSGATGTPATRSTPLHPTKPRGLERHRNAAPRPAGPPRERLAGISIAAFTAAALVGVLAANGATREFDRACRRSMRRTRRKALERGAKALSAIGEPAAQLSLACVASLALDRRSSRARSNGRRNKAGTHLAAVSPICASLSAIALHHAVKAVFHRKRPPGAWRHGNREPSFPSGHASVATATTGTSLYAALRDGVLPATLAPLAIALPLGVGWSRVYLDKHWASDVVGGVLVGLGIAAGAGAIHDAALGSPS